MADEFLNPGLPIGDASLSRVEAIARLRGLPAAAVIEAKVLEIGCGNGARALMMAECYPGSQFLGIDQSAVSVAIANETASALGLSNVSFRQQVFDSGPTALDSYDYIVCQHLYTRVPPAQSEEILRICHRHLAPNGVALVGYDAYPGQHARDMLRRMTQFDARGAASAPEMVARARMLAGFLRRSLTNTKHSYDGLIANELDVLATCDDSQVWRDYLAPHIQPRYGREFLSEVEPSGLKYLGDCALGVPYSDELKPELEQALAQLSGDEVEREQYRDLLRNRATRLTLLCHADRVIQKELQSGARDKLWLKSAIVPETAEASISHASVQFVTASGLRISTKAPLVQAALVHLGSVWPRAIEFNALLQAASDRLAVLSEGAVLATEADFERLADNMLQCAASRIIDVQSQPVACTFAISDRPLASPVARWLAQRGPLVANRDHATVHLEPLDQHLLPLLDGTRDASQQVDGLLALVQSGQIMAHDQGQPIQDASFLRGTLAQAQAQSLASLARQALLIA